MQTVNSPTAFRLLCYADSGPEPPTTFDLYSEYVMYLTMVCHA